MKLKYNKEYYDNYYEGTYEDTYQLGFNLQGVLENCWRPVFSNLPKSFADIGCGPGQTLIKAQTLLGKEAHIYGVEVQDIPKERIASDKVIFGDFLELFPQLEPVDLVYVACSMYIPWEEQEIFIKNCIKLAKKAIVFENVYLSDRNSIPEDRLRQVIYNSPEKFSAAMNLLGLKSFNSPFDFFYK